MRTLALAAVVSAGLAGAAGAAPLNEDLVQRRAIRGAPLETTRESPELRALRDFEEASFPAPLPAGRDEQERAPRAALGDGLGPDSLRPDLRSPEARAATPAVAAPPLPWLDQLRLPDLPVRFDPRVVRYLEFYRSDPRGRAIMSSWLRAQGRFRGLIEDGLRHAHLPLGLLYVAMIESGYDPLDHSHAGAVGLWQFMPEVSRIYGLRVDYWVDERRDPERATQAMMHYFVDLKERFGGWPLALAAFNAGYGAVLRAMQKYNTNDYWELCRHEDGLPWDTVLYVPKAMATALVGENRARFGYDQVAADPPYQYDRVAVPSSMSLAQAAHAAGAGAAELAALNPELRRGRTPPVTDGTPWLLRVPRGAGARFAAAYESHREMVKPFVTRFGERLDDVARAAGISTQKLRALNGIDDVSEITAGLTLLVPSDAPALPPPVPCDTVIVAVPDKEATVPGRKRLFYRTLARDSVAEIAAFFKVKSAELEHWNHLDPEARLASNLVLQLWVAPDFDERRAALVDAARVRVVTTGSDEFFDLVEARRGRARLSYSVKKGDDLKKIGRKFGLTVADLERINRFSAHHTALTVGQKLVVYREMTKAEKDKAACKLVPGGLPGGLPPRAMGAAATARPAADEPDEPDAPEAVKLPRPPVVDRD